MIVKKSLSIVAALGFVATTVQPVFAADVSIGAIYLDDVGFYAAVRKGIQNGAATMDKSIKLLETNARADAAAESSFMDRLISANVKAIIMSPVSADGSVRSIKRAKEAGIPVICYNTCINDKDMKSYVYAYTVGDPRAFGRRLGEVAAEYFMQKGIKNPQIGVLNCEFVEVCVLRREGFEDALKEKVPGYKIVSNQRGTVLDVAVSVSDQMLTAHPEIHAFFGEGGDAGPGAVRTIRQRNLVGKVVVFSADMNVPSANELADFSIMKGIADISGQGLGKLALEQAQKAMKGEKINSVVVPMGISIFKTPEDAKKWLRDHKDGLS